MELNLKHREYIDKSVLCWLATSSAKNEPNVSPKEIFNYFGKDRIIVANIASPQTVRNIKENNTICLSFIDILIQKGYQIKGLARILDESDAEFPEMNEVLLKMTKGKYPFKTITEIKVRKIKPIIAPKYILYPSTTEEEQVENAKKVYGL